MVEQIEAASRTGNQEQASLPWSIVAPTDASGSIGLATQARCRALLSGVDEAEALYREAIERLLPSRRGSTCPPDCSMESGPRQSVGDARDELERRTRCSPTSNECVRRADANRAAGRLRACRKRSVDMLGQLTPVRNRLQRPRRKATQQRDRYATLISPIRSSTTCTRSSGSCE